MIITWILIVWSNIINFSNFSSKHKSKHSTSSSARTSLAKTQQHEDNEGFSKRKIEDNTRKYEISSESEEEAPDFDYLLKLPPSTGSHFLLKSEQQKFNQDIDSTQFSKHFQLDTNVLNLALKSIPLNERHVLKDIEWNPEEIRQMQLTADANENLYREHLEKVSLKKDKTLPVKPQTLSEKIGKINIADTPASNATSSNPQSNPHSTENPKDKESIQKWLDDILDI